MSVLAVRAALAMACSGYGKAYAAAIPLATFTLLPRTGHLPQVETPEELLGALFDLGSR